MGFLTEGAAGRAPGAHRGPARKQGVWRRRAEAPRARPREVAGLKSEGGAEGAAARARSVWSAAAACAPKVMRVNFTRRAAPPAGCRAAVPREAARRAAVRPTAGMDGWARRRGGRPAQALPGRPAPRAGRRQRGQDCIIIAMATSRAHAWWGPMYAAREGDAGRVCKARAEGWICDIVCSRA